MGLIIDGVSALDLILDGQSVSLYVGGSPPVKVWPNVKEVVQITLGTGYEARDQFQAAVSARGLDHTAITEIPFEIELVGSGSAKYMFSFCMSLTTVPDLDTSGVTDMGLMFVNCRSLTHAPNMDTSQVTNMSQMFQGCSALMSVPDMHTSQVTKMSNMFRDCRSLTDGNVRLIGRHPSVTTTNMITGSGLTREPWYTADGNPAPRKVTIEKDPYVAGFKQPATGDVSLIGGWLLSGNEHGVSFAAPVTCNRDLRNADTYGTIRAGATIPIGQRVYPTYSTGTPYVFTEVL